jgi:hypothetical protein
MYEVASSDRFSFLCKLLRFHVSRLHRLLVFEAYRLFAAVDVVAVAIAVDIVLNNNNESHDASRINPCTPLTILVRKFAGYKPFGKHSSL